jgi:hypothetical protein
VNEYFEGTIRQLQARVRHLVSLIPRNLERDVDTLAIRCLHPPVIDTTFQNRVDYQRVQQRWCEV